MKFSALIATVLIATTAASAQFWQNTEGPPSESTCLTTNSKGHVFVGTPYSKVYRSTDLGSTWEPFDNGIDDGGPVWYVVNHLVIDAKDHLYAAVNGVGILKSTNDGQSWSKLDLGQAVARNARLSVSVRNAEGGVTHVMAGYDAGASALKCFFSDNNGTSFVDVPVGQANGIPNGTSSLFEVFISPNSGKMFISVAYNKGLFRTTNMGQLWRRIDNGDGSSNESDDLYQTFAADANGNLYVGRNALPNSGKTENAVVLKSTNDGDNWSYLLNGWDNRNITNNRISAISFGPNGDMWVGTEKNSGPFRSPNYGELFSVVSDGLEGDGATAGLVVTKDNNVFIAPTGGFVYRHLVTSSVEESLPFVVRTGIAPNPASDRVGVTLAAESAQRVTVDLLTAAGERAIEGMTMTVDTGGEQRVWLNTIELPNGVYMVRVAANGRATVTPVVVAR